MKIIQFTAENIKKLKVVNITPDGHLIQITGANGQGKSSVLDAIYYALAGTQGIPSEPVRKGAGKAHIKLELGEISVTRSFVEGGGTSLIVAAENGARFPSPQKMLDDLLGTLTFDPLAFTRMDAKKQLETLRSLVKLDLDIDALDKENKDDFDRRTQVNRDVKALTARRDGIPEKQGLPEKKQDVSGLISKLQNASTFNGEVIRVIEARKRNREEFTGQRTRAQEFRAQAAAMIAKADELEASAKKAEQIFVKLPEVSAAIDTAELGKEIEQARIVNEAIDVREQRGKIQSDLNDSEREAKELTEAIEKRNKQRADAIANAKMPLDSLSFGDGHVTYLGLPFDQASDSDQLRVSVAIAMAANPKLRVLRIKDGSLLDEHSLKLIAETATKNDFQIWIERVDTSGKVGIVMEDGQVSSGNTKEAAKDAGQPPAKKEKAKK